MSRHRVLSLVPSATDWLAALGTGADVVGVTHECTPPPGAGTPAVVVHPTIALDADDPAAVDAAVTAAAPTGVYAIDEDAVRELRPTLVVTQELCDVCAVPSGRVARLAAALGGVRVVNMTGTTLDEVLGDGLALGAALGAGVRAAEVVAALRARLAAVRRAVVGADRPRVAFVEWPDPLWAAGHWVPDQFAAAGGVVTTGEGGAPSRRAEPADFAGADVLLVGPCGYNLAAATAVAPSVAARVPAGEVWAVDAGGCFSRPAPRLVDGVEALAGVFHPDRWPASAPSVVRRVA